MTCELKFDDSLGVIELVLSGIVTGHDLREATSEGIALQKEVHETRCLIDATDQEQTGTVLDLYHLPSQYAEEGLDRRSLLALVLPTRHELLELALFYETVCVNRGWHVRLFPTREEAIGWLSSTQAEEVAN